MTASQFPSVADRPHSVTVCAPAAQAPHGGRALCPWRLVGAIRERRSNLIYFGEAR